MMISSTNKPEICLIADWPAPSHIKAYSTLRPSGIGDAESPYRKPGNINRHLLVSSLDLPKEPIWLQQTHSTIACLADTTQSGAEGDAIYTQQSKEPCVVLTADCLPVMVTDKKGTTVAAIHAGWRGLAGGIIEATLQKLALPPEDTLIWLGPAIGPQKFEVREDVYQAFTNPSPEASRAFSPISDSQWLADIFELARIKLHKLGITHIYGGNYCTYSDEERFFSYRRDGKIVGNVVNVIWIE